MRAEQTILSLLNPQGELLYSNHTELIQKITFYSIITIIIVASITTFLPVSKFFLILPLLMIAALIAKFLPKLNVQFEDQEMILENWRRVRSHIVKYPDFETLACLLAHKVVSEASLRSHPKFKAVAGYYELVEGRYTSQMAPA